MRISKKTREEAALLASTLAGSRATPWMVRASIEPSDVAWDLYLKAYIHVADVAWESALDKGFSLQVRDFDAEAEALLRTGWSPQ